VYLVKRYVLRAAVLRPLVSQGEPRWLAAYGVLASIYRIAIIVIIALWLVEHVPLLGLLLAGWAVWKGMLTPTLNAARYLVRDPELADRRRAVVAGVSGGLVILVSIIVWLPLPHSTRTVGIVWVQEQAEVFAAENGVIEELLVTSGEWVARGQPLWRQYAPTLDAERLRLQAKRAALRAERFAALSDDVVHAAQLRTDIHIVEQELSRLAERAASMIHKAPQAGHITFNRQLTLPGRWLEAGETVGYLVDPSELIVRAVVDQAAMGRVREGVSKASVRLAERSGQPLIAEVSHETPAGVFNLPSLALADRGFGGIPIARQPDGTVKTLEQVFHLELRLPEHAVVAGIGERAFVTLNHDPSALGPRWLRSMRQLLLRRLAV